MQYLIISLVIIIIILFILLVKKKKINKIDTNKYLKEQKVIEEQTNLLKENQNKTQLELIKIQTQLENEQNKLKEILSNYNNNIAEARTNANEQIRYINESVESARAAAKQQTEDMRRHVEELVDEVGARCQDQAMLAYIGSMNSIMALEKQDAQNTINSLEEEIKNVTIWRDTLKEEVAHFQAERQAINEEISRERAINEQQDFFRIVLSDEDKQDIDYILSIVPNFRHSETLYKLIWSEYIQKAFKTTLKNVLGARDPKNVIYIIQNINTKEIYIGKTAQCASDRWTHHVKTSLFISGTKQSAVHKAMYKHWDEFTFNILEEVPEDKDLGERERYWINFYQSNVYGYNVV